MNWCKLFGHKWQSYQQKVRVDTHLILSESKINAMINTEFRYCDKCSTNQMRVAYTGDDKWDEIHMDIFNDYDCIRGEDIVIDRFNEFLRHIGKPEVDSVKGYNNI